MVKLLNLHIGVLALIGFIACLSTAPTYASDLNNFSGVRKSDSFLRVVNCDGNLIAESQEDPTGLRIDGVQGASVLNIESPSAEQLSAPVVGGMARFNSLAGDWKICPPNGVTFGEIQTVSSSSANTELAALGSVAALGASAIIVGGGIVGGGNESSGAQASEAQPLAASNAASSASTRNGTNPSSTTTKNNRSCATADCGLDEDPPPLSPIL